MDPLTHAIVGAAVAVAGGAEVSFTSPELIAVTLGAVSPDLDIVFQYWGDYIYLKHHRGISHSLPGLLGFAALVGGSLNFIFPQVGFWVLFFWAFLGALSHTFLDLLNSYGVMLLYPFNRKKYTLNLLMISDPVLLGCSLFILYSGYRDHFWIYPSFVLGLSYLLLRFLMRRRAEALIKEYYAEYLEKLVVMPAFIGLVRWDFIVRVNKKNIVGQINLLSCKIVIHKKLKLISEEIKGKLEKTKMGKIFKEFTPFFHVDYKIEDNKLIGIFIDMRYFVRNSFLHHATVIVDTNDYKVEKALFQPYNLENKIEIS
ncbi:MAG: inner membrane protein [Clostridia bacterium]|nr:inner membrane protein [Clostridia bacterium]MDN5322433.1 inner membrane protein [Clostridia bacterium]